MTNIVLAILLPFVLTLILCKAHWDSVNLQQSYSKLSVNSGMLSTAFKTKAKMSFRTCSTLCIHNITCCGFNYGLKNKVYKYLNIFSSFLYLDYNTYIL